MGMLLSDFDFDLPSGLIAQYPLPQRSGSRLLCLDRLTGAYGHRQFIDLPELLSPSDLLIFNDTRVIPARWFGIKSSGGRVEVLLERILSTDKALVQIRASKSPKIGSELNMDGNIRLTLTERHQHLFTVCCDPSVSILKSLQQHGHIPLPPYLGRAEEPLDQTRYQTIYARQEGAVAAPTAGLHFDHAMLKKIQSMGVTTAFVTLHIGAGTFQPVRTLDIHQHTMHAEYFELSADTCALISQTKAKGGRIIAVGTTTVRALETASQTGKTQPYQGDTRLFIYPGYTFQCVDAMITNFHLPKSTLLMMIAAFGGYEAVMRCYQAAIAEKYRFFSYGDAMWIGAGYNKIFQ